GVRADRHESAVSDRHLPRVPDEDVEAERADDRDEHEVGDREVVLVECERDHENEQDRERDHRVLRDRQRIERHVGLVRGLENAALSMDHALLPKRDRHIVELRDRDPELRSSDQNSAPAMSSRMAQMRGAEEGPTEAYSEYAAGSGPTRQRSRW